eukprot:gene1453-2075_t
MAAAKNAMDTASQYDMIFDPHPMRKWEVPSISRGQVWGNAGSEVPKEDRTPEAARAMRQTWRDRGLNDITITEYHAANTAWPPDRIKEDSKARWMKAMERTPMLFSRKDMDRGHAEGHTAQMNTQETTQDEWDLLWEFEEAQGSPQGQMDDKSEDETPHPPLARPLIQEVHPEDSAPMCPRVSSHFAGSSFFSLLEGPIAFYGYDHPEASSANTGYELSDTVLVYFIVDTNNEVNMVQVLDQANDGSGGALIQEFSISEEHAEAVNFKLMDDDGDTTCIRDDPTCATYCMYNNFDCYSLDTGTGRGSMYQRWDTCCTDGTVMGPLPSTDFCFTFTIDRSDRIYAMKLLTYNTSVEPPTVQYIDVNFDEAKNGGVEGLF